MTGALGPSPLERSRFTVVTGRRTLATMDWHDHMERSPGVLAGKPVFRGTPVTVEHVLAKLGRGMPEADLLRGHPRLTADHVGAALLYAADAAGAPVSPPVRLLADGEPPPGSRELLRTEQHEV